MATFLPRLLFKSWQQCVTLTCKFFVLAFR